MESKDIPMIIPIPRTFCEIGKKEPRGARENGPINLITDSKTVNADFYWMSDGFDDSFETIGRYGGRYVKAEDFNLLFYISSQYALARQVGRQYQLQKDVSDVIDGYPLWAVLRDANWNEILSLVWNNKGETIDFGKINNPTYLKPEHWKKLVQADWFSLSNNPISKKVFFNHPDGTSLLYVYQSVGVSKQQDPQFYVFSQYKPSATIGSSIDAYMYPHVDRTQKVGQITTTVTGLSFAPLEGYETIYPPCEVYNMSNVVDGAAEYESQEFEMTSPFSIFHILEYGEESLWYWSHLSPLTKYRGGYNINFNSSDICLKRVGVSDSQNYAMIPLVFFNSFSSKNKIYHFHYHSSSVDDPWYWAYPAPLNIFPAGKYVFVRRFHGPHTIGDFIGKPRIEFKSITKGQHQNAWNSKMRIQERYS